MKGCGHSVSDHAKKGPKPYHVSSNLYAKQLASTIIWRNYPILNGPYTYYPTTDKAFCNVALCTCTDFVGKGKICATLDQNKGRRGGNGMTGTAEFSPCGKYRYTLTRSWGDGVMLLVVMLNPSTADANVNDPTISRVLHRAKEAGYGSLTVCNLFAYRSPYPKDLQNLSRCGIDIDGKDNKATLERIAAQAGDAVVAWGNHKLVAMRERSVLNILYSAKLTVECLGVTKDGYPRHPLHVGYVVPFHKYQGRFAR